MLITSAGTLVRTPVADISVLGRNTQGVRLIRLDQDDRLVGIERVEALPDVAGELIDSGAVLEGGVLSEDGGPLEGAASIEEAPGQGGESDDEGPADGLDEGGAPADDE
jgi:DNA gyrase subunit A